MKREQSTEAAHCPKLDAIAIVQERSQLEFIVQPHDLLHVLRSLLRHPNIEIYSLDEGEGI